MSFCFKCGPCQIDFFNECLFDVWTLELFIKYILTFKEKLTVIQKARWIWMKDNQYKFNPIKVESPHTDEGPQTNWEPGLYKINEKISGNNFHNR